MTVMGGHLLYSLSGLLLVLWCGIYVTSAETAASQVEALTIKETDPDGTVILRINGNVSKAFWTVHIDGEEITSLRRYFRLIHKGSISGIALARPLDLEVLSYANIKPFDTLDLTVAWKNVHNQDEVRRLNITLEPVNEFAPVFVRAPYLINIPENLPVGSTVFDLRDKVLDMDAGNSYLSFRISPYIVAEFDGRGLFRMKDESSGSIVVSTELDFETMNRVGRAYYLNVTVTDRGGMSSSTSVNVTVADVNDQGIEFVVPGCSEPCLDPTYEASVNESTIGHVDILPLAIKARDLDDLGDQVTYSLTEGPYDAYFKINTYTGELMKILPLDNSTDDIVLYLEVIATEVTDVTHIAVANVTITVEDRAAKAATSTTVAPVVERSDIECESDVIRIFFPSQLIPSDRNVTWRDVDCAVRFNGTHFVDVIGVDDCGTTVQITNDSIVFQNDVIVHTGDPSNVISGPITHGEDYNTVVPVKCVYPRNRNVSTSYTPVKQNIRFFERRYGQLEVSMQQYETETYETAITEFPRKIPLDNDIFIKLDLAVAGGNLGLRADNCIATSTPSPADVNWYQLILLGCPKDEVRIQSETGSRDVRFTFKAFDFTHNATGFVYIHCEVSVCSVTDPQCYMGCPTRVRRSAEHRGGSHLVSTGPLIVTVDNSDKVSGLGTTLFAIASLCVAVLATVVAVIGWTRKPRQHARGNNL